YDKINSSVVAVFLDSSGVVWTYAVWDQIIQCAKAAIHVRETQCSKLDLLSSNKHMQEHERWCVVMCRSAETGEEKELRKMSDGTPCFIEGYNTSVCMNGTCQVHIIEFSFNCCSTYLVWPNFVSK
ncbi:unnamed protein product, partial [Gongylonema pulchrum]|uniref:PPM-type phosphatase domain-containing protein n=1 Tax=Gongylonema pulchrum TaxID=637853 RepID=A0A183E421_9BILA